jgi:hypothetical protein
MKITVFWDVTPFGLVGKYSFAYEHAASIFRLMKPAGSSETLLTTYNRNTVIDFRVTASGYRQ